MKKKVIIIIILVLILGGIIGTSLYFRHTTLNVENANGNTQGNLINGGLFAEADGKIYFANPYDNNYLYSMNLDCTEPELVQKDSVSGINVCGKYIYYCKTGSGSGDQFDFLKVNAYSLCRINKNGGHLNVLDANPSMNPILVGNYIYYVAYTKETASTTNKVKIDGKEKQTISKTAIWPLCADGYYLYYLNTEEVTPAVFKLNAKTGNKEEVYRGTCYNIMTDDNFIYFMDAENNYRLSRTYLPTEQKETLTSARVDLYNMDGSHLYYQTNGKNPGLYMCDLDGSNEKLIAEGTYSNLHVTSAGLFYNEYGTKKPIYLYSNGSVKTIRFEEKQTEK